MIKGARRRVSMADLASLKKLRQKIDQQIYDYSLKLLAPFYRERRETVKQIPRFWAITVGETEPWRPYITYEDSLAFETLEDVWIEWDPNDSRNFVVSFHFGDNPHFPRQVLQKHLVWKEDLDEDDADAGYYESEEPTIISLNPGVKLLDQHDHGGQESFFTWFGYTKTDKKEDRRENTVIAQLLVDEIYPAAIDLYDAAQEEQDVAEEYDISDDE